ncbi:TetR/AcrR family transcriptional regulator [Williamsia sp. 1135]|uniref:TetR/AcrR family transcriptional regulator n=1 Tax=Williamsia sp. 1135 TaxID=1889262 RepID=UPI000A122A43|nr:TetR/AcrR family transcriptional regulator [Williamsia sp. 1135]ORM34088.1 TetR family transcriptional regulator [Williamsia sp. 1135]
MTSAPTTRAGSHPDQDAEPSHRARLLNALGVSIEERGYRATTVSDIVREARTSRRTFYQEFGTKEECFIELLHTANTDMIDDIVAAVDPDAPWRTQIRQAVEAYVRSIEARPALTLSWIRELPALGPTARPVQRQAMEDFIQTLIALTDTDRMRAAGISTISRSLALLMLGGLRELTAVAVEDGQPVSDTTETMVDACVALLLPR